MKDNLSIAISGTRVDVSVAVELDASLARCAGWQNDPAGSLHALGGGVSLSHSSAGHFYPNTSRGDSPICGFQSWRKRVFAFLSIAPLVEETIVFLWCDAVVP